MTEELKLPEAVVDEFANDAPTAREVDRVKKVLKTLPGNPKIGSPIPFDLPEYENCFVTWTPDKQWRIVFRRNSPSSINVLSIAREDS